MWASTLKHDIPSCYLYDCWLLLPPLRFFDCRGQEDGFLLSIFAFSTGKPIGMAPKHTNIVSLRPLNFLSLVD